jgi:putative transposase
MTIRYPSVRADDAVLRDRMKAIAHERRRFGYRPIHVPLRREGVTFNHKRLFTAVPRGKVVRAQARRPQKSPWHSIPILVPLMPNQR